MIDSCDTLKPPSDGGMTATGHDPSAVTPSDGGFYYKDFGFTSLMLYAVKVL